MDFVEFFKIEIPSFRWHLKLEKNAVNLASLVLFEDRDIPEISIIT